MHRVEVRLKKHLPDARGLSLVKDIRDLGIESVLGIRVVDVYLLDAELPAETLQLIASKLLADPVTEEYRFNGLPSPNDNEKRHLHTVEVAYNPGVFEPIEASIMKALADLGVERVRGVKTAKRYIIEGGLKQDELTTICSKLLVNPIVQHVVEEEWVEFPHPPTYTFKLTEVDDIEGVGGRLGLSQDEAAAVAAYFHKEGRKPTDVELETLAQTWSEHCVHKTFRGRIKLNGEEIDGLLKQTIMKATKELAKPWCLSVFSDNAGVIDFNGDHALCFKVETHNHPSAIEPYGGAATGIGGVVRDPLGTGLGAKPIANTDVFCFAPPNFPHERLPKGVLHPRRIFKGVHAGVADYGNRLGIPTLNGAVLFDERYLGNPLVYCGTVGLMPAQHAQQGVHSPGDLVVVAGGRTGRDGIRGVTFASVELTDESSEVSTGSVQIGNPIVEKKLIDTIIKARDRGLFSRITDCGGGGLSSAVGEMGEETGVKVYLDKVPLKYAGLSYDEIWISESQERMALAVPPQNIDELMGLFESENVEAAVIGEFTDDKKLKLYYKDEQVCDLDMAFLHNGRPPLEMEATFQPPSLPTADFPPPPDLGAELKRILGSWNTCSKEWVIRQYDHEVQGASVLKPLVGIDNDGPGDAAIIRPLLADKRGVVISNGINTRYGDIDPYWMAASAIDEALRQIIAVGGDLKRVALLDNFSWGNTDRPEMLGALARACRACYDMAVVYGTPFISGKDSLNNEFQHQGRRIAIPHTLLISAIGVMEDTTRAVSMDLKRGGDLIYIVGSTSKELGGSEYLAAHGLVGDSVPHVDPKRARLLMENLSRATAKRLVSACHDISEGGMGVAAAEMAFAGGVGAEIALSDVPLGEPMDREDYILFSESNSRFLVEVTPQNKDAFEGIMGDSAAAIGKTTTAKTLEIHGLNGDTIIKSSLVDLKEAWQNPLRW